MLKELVARVSGDTISENKRAIIKLVEPNENAKVLELGPEDGSFTLELGKAIGTDQLYTVDIMDEFVQKCEAKGIKAHKSDLNEAMPFEDDSFDIVVANQVLEHLHNTDLFITEVYRILKPEEYAIISTPNLAAWHNIACLFLGWGPFSVSLPQRAGVGNPLFAKSDACVEHHPEHYRIPTYRGLKEMLMYYGLKKQEIIGTGYYPFPKIISGFLSYIDPRHSVILTARVRKVI